MSSSKFMLNTTTTEVAHPECLEVSLPLGYARPRGWEERSTDHDCGPVVRFHRAETWAEVVCCLCGDRMVDPPDPDFLAVATL